MATDSFLIQEEYELSIWEEERKFNYDSENANLNYLNDIIEYPIAIIGGDSIKDPSRARDVTLRKNINGSNTLTFTMCARYIDLNNYDYDFERDMEWNHGSEFIGYGNEKYNNNYVENPFIKYLKNESKLKLFYKDKWYDFIIKDIQEDSDKLLYKYTAKDLFINELSRNGYDIELSTELGNNMGTAQDLGEIALAGSDWQIDKSSIIKQYIDEPLYSGKLDSRYSVFNLETQNTETLEPGTTIYIFYSCCINENPFIQFLSLKPGETEIKADSNGILLNVNQYTLRFFRGTGQSEEYFPIVYKDGYPGTMLYGNFSNILVNEGGLTLEQNLRGKRLVRSPFMKYDTNVEKMVTKCTYKEISNCYYYEETEFQKNFMPTNKIGANENFRSLYDEVKTSSNTTSKSIYGWTITKNGFEIKDNNLVLKPINGTATNNSVFDFSVNSVKKGDYWYFIIQLNDSLPPSVRDYFKSYPSAIPQATTLPIVTLKAISQKTAEEQLKEPVCYFSPGAHGSEDSSEPMGIKVSLHSNVDKTDPMTETEWSTAFRNYMSENNIKNCFLFVGKMNRDFDSDYLKDKKFELTIRLSESMRKELVIKKIELIRRSPYWKIYKDTSGNQIIKQSISFPSFNSTTLKAFQDYELSIQKTVVFRYNNDSIEYIYDGPTEYLQRSEPLKTVYDDTFAKVSYIEEKESNRFNIIQSICEKFECWATFDIEHDSNGYIVKEDAYIVPDSNGRVKYYKKSSQAPAPAGSVSVKRQKKTIKFVETPVPEKNAVGFKYGINLKQITRTVNSDQLSTFVIVKNNNNEFATNGFCSVARASENYSKENSIINFDYYIQMGLLDRDMLYKDLYVNNPADGHIGYYYALRKINNQIDAINRGNATISVDLEAKKSRLDSTTLEYNSSVKLYDDLVERYYSRYGKTQDTELTDSILKDHIYPPIAPTSDGAAKILKKLVDDIREVYFKIKDMQDDIERYQSKYVSALDAYENSLNQVDELIKKKAIIINKFRSKYSRFIQEGTWSDDSYIDDNKYYLDALKVANTSSKPQISYNISVVDINPIMDTNDYSFEVGQVTTMEDPNFFGYNSDGLPYKEEVIISEITYHLDSPDKNEITVQNYRTQWEDLFQRISATVQNLQYAEGSYAKAAGILTPDGNIKVEVLQSVIDNNSVTLQNAINESVVWDDKGITITSKTNASNILRLVSNGVYVSQDGGSTYINAIRGDGISASVLTAGVVNTQAIVICNGEAPSFHWDEFGISAYQFESIEAGAAKVYDLSTFVRFDRFGVYGIKERSVDWVPTKTSDIVNEAHFSLTWNGFNLKTGEKKGVRINETDDIILYEYIYDDDGDHIEREEGYWDYNRIVKIGTFDSVNKNVIIESNGSQTSGTDDYYHEETKSYFYGYRGYKDSFIQLVDITDNLIDTSTQEEFNFGNVLTLFSNPDNKIMYLDALNNAPVQLNTVINLTRVEEGISYVPFYLAKNGSISSTYLYTGNGGMFGLNYEKQPEFGYMHSYGGSRTNVGANLINDNGNIIYLAEIGVGPRNSYTSQKILTDTSKNFGEKTDGKEIFATDMESGEKVISFGGTTRDVTTNYYIYFGYKNSYNVTVQKGQILFNESSYTFLRQDNNGKYHSYICGKGFTSKVNRSEEEASGNNTYRESNLTANGLQFKEYSSFEEDKILTNTWSIGKDTRIKTLTIDNHCKFESFIRDGKTRIGCYIS